MSIASAPVGSADNETNLGCSLSPAAAAFVQSILGLLLAFQIYLCIKFFWSADGLHTLQGVPLYGDFKVFWIEARHALQGRIQYDQTALHEEIASLFELRFALLSYLYPPDYALLIAPFGLLPFQLAGLTWSALGIGAYVSGLRALFGRLPWLPLMAFTGVSQSLLTGQNSLFTTALFAATFALAKRAPVLAGLSAAVLATKPQLAVLIPILLLASRHWGALASTVVAKLILMGASLAVFGMISWEAFLTLGDEVMAINAGHYRQSVYNIVSNLDGPAWLGFALQAFSAASACLLIALTIGHARRPIDVAALGAAATPLISPVFLDYDLTILAIPAAYLALHHRLTPADRVLLGIVLLLPMTARWITIFTHLTTGPIIAALLFGRVANFIRRPNPNGNSHRADA